MMMIQFVRDDVASENPMGKMLKGFTKVHLKEGETQKVSFELGYKDFGFFDSSATFVVEPGTFSLSVGPLSASFSLE